MSREDVAEANRHVREALALLEACVDRTRRDDANLSVHSRAVIARESLRHALDRLGELEESISLRQQQQP